MNSSSSLSMVALFTQNRADLVNYVSRLGIPYERADDIVSLAGLKILRHADTLTVPFRASRGWLFRVTLNTLRDEARKPRFPLLSELSPSDTMDELASCQWGDACPSPEKLMIRDIEEAEAAVARVHALDVLQRGLARLTPEQRQVMLLWQGKRQRPFLGGCSLQSEIARMMGISTSGVSRLGKQAWESLSRFFHREAARDPQLRRWLRSWAA